MPINARQSFIPAEEFKALRQATGMSQAKFARTIGLYSETVGKWETGENPVPKWGVLLAQLFAAKRQALITGQRPTLSIDEN